MTGLNSTQRNGSGSRHLREPASFIEETPSGDENIGVSAHDNSHGKTVPQPEQDATKNDHSGIKQDNNLFSNEEHDSQRNPLGSAQQSPFSSFFNFFKPGSNKSSNNEAKTSPNAPKIYKRSQTIQMGDEASSDQVSEDNTHGRPNMARGNSLLDDPDSVFAPPKTTVFEAAGDLLSPPLPTQEFIVNPAKRPRTIFHDRVYHPGDIPPPAARRPSLLRRLSSQQSQDGLSTDSSHSNNRHITADQGSMRVEEKIARSYHKDLSWRKVLVRLEPDAHNNMVVRRMFSNAYGWPVVKHLVDAHFGDTYSVPAGNREDTNKEGAISQTDSIGEHGEEVKDTLSQKRTLTEDEVKESRDELHDLHVPPDNLSSTVTGKPHLGRQDSINSVGAEDWVFDETTDDDDDEDDPDAPQNPASRWFFSRSAQGSRQGGEALYPPGGAGSVGSATVEHGLHPVPTKSTGLPFVTKQDGTPLLLHPKTDPPSLSMPSVGLRNSLEEQLAAAKSRGLERPSEARAAGQQ